MRKSTNNGTGVMEFSLLDDGEDAEHSGFGFIEIANIHAMQDQFLSNIHAMQDQFLSNIHVMQDQFLSNIHAMQDQFFFENYVKN